ncbi:L,D-transpeptidase family protein [Henriciella aquimarina]|uniref:L,D-transpeptidase family protein n=1 Tax=Henriciella aquimarina TaxID=545261 RepID=UPI001EEF08FE|nr:L,D-transpeptidase family protein [Henriciella aquimarina]
MRAIFLASLLACGVSAWPLTSAGAPPADVQHVSTPPRLQADLRTNWTRQDVQGLIEAIEGLRAHGLDPSHYHLNDLALTTQDGMVDDDLATQAWLSAAGDLLHGKVDPHTVASGWSLAARKADLPKALAVALETGTVSTSLEQFAPANPAYTLLKDELKKLRQEEPTPIAEVPDGPVLKTSMSGERVRALQLRLVALGKLSDEQVSESMDEATVAAVEAFQGAQGLDADGIVGPATLRALNRGPEARMEQLRINMERLRWMPDDLGQRHVRANIAAFEASAVEDGVSRQDHRLMVGKPSRQSPLFSSEIEAVVLNPWWEVPSRLARYDLLPKFQWNPGAVELQGFQVINGAGRQVDPSSINWKALSPATFPYRLRQAPGPYNPLGRVKVMFPNAYEIRMHDTTRRDLFERSQRALSSGCLRVQAPVDLVTWLLSRTEDWDRAAIEAAIASDEVVRVELARTVPIHILYLTAVSDGAGGVRYLDDVYQRDGELLAALEAPPED